MSDFQEKFDAALEAVFFMSRRISCACGATEDLWLMQDAPGVMCVACRDKNYAPVDCTCPRAPAVMSHECDVHGRDLP